MTELTLMAGETASWPLGHESGRTGPTLPHLPCGGMRKGKMPSSLVPWHLWQSGELSEDEGELAG